MQSKNAPQILNVILKQRCEFLYSVNDGEFIYAGAASTKFITTDIAERCFTETVIGVYAQSEENTEAKAIIYGCSAKS